MSAIATTRAMPKQETGGAPDRVPTAEQIATLVRIARDLAGIVLDPDKTEFISVRLTRLMRENHVKTYGELVEKTHHDAGFKRMVAEAFTTHTTSFFRENMHYQWLREKALGQFAARGFNPQTPLTIWSAACSNGAELWSAAMVVAEYESVEKTTLPCKFIGSDVSRRILQQAAGATYTESEMSGVSRELRARYFLRANGRLARRSGHLYRVKPELRARASFRFANLLDASEPLGFQADIIFLRNVLIYFAVEDRDRAVRRLVSTLRPGGALLTGHSESIDAHRYGLKKCAPSTYRKQ